MRNPKVLVLVLLVWAVAATAAAVWFASSPDPEPTPPPEPSPRAAPRLLQRPRPGGGSVELAALLMKTIEPPAGTPEDTRPVPVRVRDIIKRLMATVEGTKEGLRTELALGREMLPLVAQEVEAHLTLMEMLTESESDREISFLLGFLVWNPVVRQTSLDTVTEKIRDMSREMLASDASVDRRLAAVRVLCNYDHPGRAEFLFCLERLGEEPDQTVRDELLEWMSVVGEGKGLTSEEVRPFVGMLRERLREGLTWCAVALVDWTDAEEDFLRVRQLLESARTDGALQDALNALAGGSMLLRGRSAEARALLVSVMENPGLKRMYRDIARSFLSTHGPLSPEDAAAVRRFEDSR